MPINKKKKELLCQFVQYKCESCKLKFEIAELQIHRINRGFCGGSYEEFRNLKVLCKKCHKKIHQNEFKNIGSKY